MACCVVSQSYTWSNAKRNDPIAPPARANRSPHPEESTWAQCAVVPFARSSPFSGRRRIATVIDGCRSPSDSSESNGPASLMYAIPVPTLCRVRDARRTRVGRFKYIQKSESLAEFAQASHGEETPRNGLIELQTTTSRLSTFYYCQVDNSALLRLLSTYFF